MRENKRTHLNMIQNVISRMAENTFLIKGWSITALGAIYALGINTKEYRILYLTLALTIFFWFHDAYYLRLERGFRNYYNEVRQKKEDEIDFEIRPLFTESFLCVMVRPILIGSYGSMLIINLMLLYIFK